MALNEQIIADMTAAMKSQEKFTLSVLRMLKSALQLEKINKKHDLTDEEVIAVIKKQVKMRKDSLEEYTKYGKTDEIDNLTKEIEVLSKYLPEELSEEAINKILDEVFDEIKPESIKDMGKVMKAAGEKFAGRADMTTVSALVRQKLN
ncbi:MAG: GatB/YqeY domain-containing protein [Bacilli bacterium]|nr:GatB/YqeY domain-containing protein [Bacilli bacterium]